MAETAHSVPSGSTYSVIEAPTSMGDYSNRLWVDYQLAGRLVPYPQVFSAFSHVLSHSTHSDITDYSNRSALGQRPGALALSMSVNIFTAGVLTSLDYLNYPEPGILSEVDPRSECRSRDFPPAFLVVLVHSGSILPFGHDATSATG